MHHRWGAPQREAHEIHSHTHRMVLPVRKRIHCGIGRFCFCFFPRIRLILNDLCDGWRAAEPRRQNAEHAGATLGGDAAARRAAEGFQRVAGCVGAEQRVSRHGAQHGPRLQVTEAESSGPAPASRRAACGMEEPAGTPQRGRASNPRVSRSAARRASANVHRARAVATHHGVRSGATRKGRLYRQKRRAWCLYRVPTVSLAY